MSELISITRSFCCDCQTTHEARFEEVENEVHFSVNCPSGPKSVVISSDAALFKAIRAKSSCDFSNPRAAAGYSWENFVEITNDCNFKCPTCFVPLTDENRYYVSYSKFLQKVAILKKEKRASVTISGGEPTLHPGLFKMIKGAARKGITPKILTNGSKLGEDAGFAKKLKKSRLEYCFIQFDTLNKETSMFIRNNNLIELKKKALLHARKADLFMGVNTLVFRQNLNELKELLGYFFTFTPQLSIINLICPVKATGRFEIKDEHLVDREAVINTVIASGVIRGLKAEHFRPLPRFSALGIDLHPDCLAVTVAALVKGRAVPLDNFIDFDKLYKLLKGSTMKVRPIFGSILFVLLLLQAIRPKKLISCIRMLFGFIFKRGSRSFVIITIEQFMNEVYQDIERIKHCTTNIVLENGELVPGCVYNHPDKRRAKHTRHSSY